MQDDQPVTALSVNMLDAFRMHMFLPHSSAQLSQYKAYKWVNSEINDVDEVHDLRRLL
jgi:hypothetical protein